jgi:hypothetical protein
MLYFKIPISAHIVRCNFCTLEWYYLYVTKNWPVLLDLNFVAFRLRRWQRGGGDHSAVLFFLVRVSVYHYFWVSLVRYFCRMRIRLRKGIKAFRLIQILTTPCIYVGSKLIKNILLKNIQFVFFKICYFTFSVAGYGYACYSKLMDILFHC